MTIKNGYFIPEEDIFETLPDGRLIQRAAKGVPVAEAEARRQGFIKDNNTGPSETKVDAPDSTKVINIGKAPPRKQ